MIKKFFALFLALLLVFTALPALAFSNGGGTENYDSFYSAVSQLTASRWDDNYFSSASISVGENTLEVDDSTITLSDSAEIVDGELLIPAEVFNSLGAELPSDTQDIVVRNGKPILPESLLGDTGLEYEILFDETSGDITITNDYQMARVVAKAAPGKSIPKLKEAVQTLAGPDGLYVIQFDDEAQARAAVETLSLSSNVLFAEPDTLVSLVGDTSYQPPASNIANSTGTVSAVSVSHLGWGAGRIKAAVYINYLTATGKQNAQVIVAVLDTGLTAAHPIFSGRHVSGRNFINSSAPPNDGHGHGTHVSGTVLDVTISLPNVKIMPVKVLSDAGSGTSVGVANGIRWAADNGAKVINLSLGGNHTQITDDAVNYSVGKNVTVVAAAGNENTDAKSCCPAHNASAITVSAFDSLDRPAPFTNYGTVVDVAAPGVAIISAKPNGGIASMSGTSMAAPHVAGAAALLLCDNPSLPPAAVKSLIKESVDPITSGTQYYGSGILNIGKAAGSIEIVEPPTEPDEPDEPDKPDEPAEPPEIPQPPQPPEPPETPQPPQPPEPPQKPQPPQRPVPPEAPKPPQEPEPPDAPQPPEQPEPPEIPQPPQKPDPPEAPLPPQRPLPPETPQPPKEPEPPARPTPPSR